MSNNIKETVFDKTKRYNKDTFERIKEFFLFSSNELQRNQKVYFIKLSYNVHMELLMS